MEALGTPAATRGLEDASCGPPQGRLGLGLTPRWELSGMPSWGPWALPGRPSCSLRAPFLHLENAAGDRVTSKGSVGSSLP